MKRILFYHHFDPQNEIKGYVLYFLKAFKDLGCDICFASNSELSKNETRKLKSLTNHILLRENKGYDFASWRDQLLSWGAEKLSIYAQVIIANSTIYGPLFPVDGLLDDIHKSGVDFWAPTLHSAAHGIPVHVQPYVCVFNKKLHQSPAFWTFWRSIQDDYENAWDVIWKAEIRMTYDFVMAGFTYGVYFDVADVREVRALGHYEPFVLHAASYMIKKAKLPFVKVKAFYHLETRALQQAPLIFAALEHTRSPYPTELITDHLRRTTPLSWHKNLKPTMIGQGLDVSTVKKTNKTYPKIGVFVHLFYKDSFPTLINYLGNIPSDFDLNITTSNKALKNSFNSSALKHISCLKSIDIRLIKNRGRDIAPWIIEFRDKHLQYDLALKLQVKRHAQHPEMFSQLWNSFMFESLLHSKEHVTIILDAFLRDPQLGLAFPTYPPFYNLIYPQGYRGSPEDQMWYQAILDKFDCANPADPNQPIFSAGGMSWYRPKAFEALLSSDYKYTDFPAEPFPTSGTLGHGLERALPYIAQSTGYTYRTVMPVDLLRQSFLMYEDRIMSTYISESHSSDITHPPMTNQISQKHIFSVLSFIRNKLWPSKTKFQ